MLTKALVGVDAATEIPAETFTFSVTAQGSTEPVETVKLPSEDATLSNTAAWTAIVDVPAGTYTVTETEPQDIGEQWAYKTTTNTINAQDKADWRQTALCFIQMKLCPLSIPTRMKKL